MLVFAKKKMSSPAGCCRLAQAPTPTPRPGGSLAASGPPPSSLLLLPHPCPPPRGCRTRAARRGRRCGQSPRTQPEEGGTETKARTVFFILKKREILFFYFSSRLFQLQPIPLKSNSSINLLFWYRCFFLKKKKKTDYLPSPAPGTR